MLPRQFAHKPRICAWVLCVPAGKGGVRLLVRARSTALVFVSGADKVI